MTQWVIFFKHLNFRLGILASVSLFGDDINSSGENELVTCSRQGPPGTKRDTPKQQQAQAHQLTIWCSTKGKQNWVNLNSGETQIVTR